MKRLFTAALSAALLLSLALPSSAAGTGRAVDWALYTDCLLYTSDAADD